jgi:hypothetical protein
MIEKEKDTLFLERLNKQNRMNINMKGRGIFNHMQMDSAINHSINHNMSGPVKATAIA